MIVSNIGNDNGFAFIVDDMDALLELVKAIRNVNMSQKDWVGEYIMMLSTEGAWHRLDVAWASDDDRITFGAESDIYEAIRKEIVDGMGEYDGEG